MLLKRQFVTLPVDETVVVINTLDENYLNQAVNYCKEIGVEYHITESNGTPGKGKNAVQDVFLASDDEYCVQIDGDDIVTPYGVDFYKDIASRNPPDGIMNLNTTAVGRHRERNIYTRWPDAPRYEMNLEEWHRKYPMKRKEIAYALERKDIWLEAINKIKVYQRIWNYPPDVNRLSQCPRFLFWSRKLCDHFRFNEDLMVGEDTIAIWHLRDVSYRGLIRLEKVDDEKENTYIYDHRRSGIMRPLSISLNWDWTLPLVREMEALAPNWTVPKEYSLNRCYCNISKEKQKLLAPIINEYFL
jgi:hypothetical protein